MLQPRSRRANRKIVQIRHPLFDLNAPERGSTIDAAEPMFSRAATQHLIHTRQGEYIVPTYVGDGIQHATWPRNTNPAAVGG